MMKLLIATTNEGKKNEILSFLGKMNGIEFLSLTDLENIPEDPEETGTTYSQNAQQKAEYYANVTGFSTLAEDSGIEVDALKGELGIKTRRWGAGPNATDQEWIDVFLERMKNETNRNARFFCSACLILPNSEPKLFEGTCQGTVLQKTHVQLEKGIPLSSYFVPEGKKEVFSFLSQDEKNSISHRGMAIGKVKKYLQGL